MRLFSKNKEVYGEGILNIVPPKETKEEREARLAREQELIDENKDFNATPVGVKLPEPVGGEAGLNLPTSFRGSTRMNVATYNVSTFTASAAYPWLAEGGLGNDAAFMGLDLSGSGPFCAHPRQWYKKGIINGTNIIVMGDLGTGKSTVAKSFATRLMYHGEKIAVASDRKGEWVRVAKNTSGEVISIGPGHNTRINPLDPGSRPSREPDGSVVTDEAWAQKVFARRLKLLGTLCQILLKRDFHPTEHTALASAVSRVTLKLQGETPTIPDVIEELRTPEEDGDGAVTGEESRDLIHSLQRTLKGDLAGMFDGPSTVHFDEKAPIVVIDTSALKEASQEASLMANACTSTWVEAAVTNPDGGNRIIIYEEGWGNLADTYSLARMVEQWKLAREYGISNMLIMHKLADLKMAGDVGSQAYNMAQSLLSDTQIRIIYRQAADALAVTKETLGLTDPEIGFIKDFARGVGLWRIGNRSVIVRNVISEQEGLVFDTNSRMFNETSNQQVDNLGKIVEPVAEADETELVSSGS